jgi:uncharacterized protein
MSLDLRQVLKAVLQRYALPWHGPHGVAHWARVLENGLYLAEFTRAKTEVVQLFAVLHDSQRTQEGADPAHGPLAAEFAVTLQGRFFHLPDADLAVLCTACAGHTTERTHPDVTIQTCWDADRLDLGRVRVTPNPKYLCTEAARRPETLQWANARAVAHALPELVSKEWGIDLKRVHAGS